MSEFFEIFNPGARFQRQQRDLDKTFVMQQKKGGRGPLGIDLEAGTMVIKPRTAKADPTSASSADAQPAAADGPELEDPSKASSEPDGE